MIQINDNVSIGNGSLCIIAGPCSIESEEQFLKTAMHVKANGASILRGGVYKLRTSPDSFQGLGSNAYDIVNKVKKQLNMPFITEVTDPRQISDLSSIADVFQVGSRNMYNYDLLKELGRYDKPVLLKRGFSATVQEWTLAAKYVESAGNPNVILCERGIRGFDTVTRNILDLATVSWVKQNTDYPVIVDPSHGTGVRNLVAPMAMAAVASGADGLIVEVHPNPEQALSDGFQSLYFDDFEKLNNKLHAIHSIL